MNKPETFSQELYNAARCGLRIASEDIYDFISHGANPMTIPVITHEQADHLLSWQQAVTALAEGHTKQKAQLGDQFLPTHSGTMMARSASIEGLGSGVKSFTVTPQNTARGLPSVQGAMIVFDEDTGTPKAFIESDLVTKWKTVADSLLGAQLLANPNPSSLSIIGAGTVAENLIAGYKALFPSLARFTIWNRGHQKAEALVERLTTPECAVVANENLAETCQNADIISAATLATEPVIKGAWVNPGTHVDLIGAFKAEMREADDALLQKARIFVDSFETTIDHIGELKIPLASGAIKRSDVLADLYELVPQNAKRLSKDEITLFKNGGGAHLDLMIADMIIKAVA